MQNAINTIQSLLCDVTGLGPAEIDELARNPAVIEEGVPWPDDETHLAGLVEAFGVVLTQARGMAEIPTHDRLRWLELEHGKMNQESPFRVARKFLGMSSEQWASVLDVSLGHAELLCRADWFRRDSTETQNRLLALAGLAVAGLLDAVEAQRKAA